MEEEDEEAEIAERGARAWHFFASSSTHSSSSSCRERAAVFRVKGGDRIRSL
jgi:hypothetical protein